MPTDLPLAWIAFAVIVVTMLALDLFVFHRKAHEPTRRESLTWAIVWIGLAALFNLGVYITAGTEKGLEWTAGYLIEETLSVDNIFVFLLVFSAFGVPNQYRHRVLFWGILGAVVMRALLIGFAGVLLHTLHFMIYVFGAFLILTGIKFLRDKDDHVPDLDKNGLVRLARRFYPVWPHYEGQKFSIVHDGKRYLTPLALVLIVVESTDLVFAVDSIPAIYGVTEDPFIVYTSNIFAILGLRSIYFVLAGYLSSLVYLKPALAAILVFVGSKMLLSDRLHLHPAVGLLVILSILTLAVVLSLRKTRGAGAADSEAAALDPHAGIPPVQPGTPHD
jgi:tellurite resistance protein TerC